MRQITTSLMDRGPTSHRWRTGWLTAGTALAVALSAAPAHAASTSFGFTGSEQTFAVPAAVTSAQVTAIGSRGNTGRGAVVTGTIAVTPGQILYVEVGGYTSGPGFNGGGSPRGGGASDVRTVPAAAGLASLQSRLIVAGGAGGDGVFAGGDANSGVYGPGGISGTQTGPGVGVSGGGSGTLGVGGAGVSGGGGGGGGFYGGGGAGEPYLYPLGGGGGSSLVPLEGTLTLAPLTTPARVDVTYFPTPARAPAPAPAPALPNVASFTIAPKSLRVSKAGRFTYRFSATPGRGGTVKLASTKKVKVGSKKRKLAVAAKSFAAAADGNVKVTFKLSAKNLKALKRKASVTFRVDVVLGSQEFTAKLKLKAPKSS